MPPVTPAASVLAPDEFDSGNTAHAREEAKAAWLDVDPRPGEEMAALRAELISLRSHLEALLGTDLGERPALASDRVAMAPPP